MQGSFIAVFNPVNVFLAEAMIADMIKPEFRDYIKDLSSSKYGVDLKKRAQDDAPVESFRKLNVD